MTTGLIFDIRKFSIHDGPGIRTTVFFKGCPLSCLWCHNPESKSFQQELIVRDNRCIRCGACVLECEQGAIRLDGDIPNTDRELCIRCGACTEACAADARQLVGREMTVAQVLREIERDLPFYEESGGGVTFSGGEPLSQSAFLSELLEACKALEIHTALDTSGQASWDTLDRVRPYVDLFLYDLKLIDDVAHKRFVGVSNRLLLGNLEKLAQAGHRIILRVPVIPGITDGSENLRQIGALAARLPGVEQVDLLPYHPSALAKYDYLQQCYQLAEVVSPSEERMAALASLLDGGKLKVKIGG